MLNLSSQKIGSGNAPEPPPSGPASSSYAASPSPRPVGFSAAAAAAAPSGRRRPRHSASTAPAAAVLAAAAPAACRLPVPPAYAPAPAFRNRRADSAREAPPPCPAFDSLLEAGRVAEARLLCAGQMLRMFDFIALAQAKMAGWSTRPLPGEPWKKRTAATGPMSRFPAAWSSSALSWARTPSAPSRPSTFLYQSPVGPTRGLADRGNGGTGKRNVARAPAHRSARRRGPAGSAAGAAAPGACPGPVPRLAPGPARGRRGRPPAVRLRLRNGAALAATCPTGARSIPHPRRFPSEWILENRRGRPFRRSTASPGTIVPGQPRIRPAHRQRCRPTPCAPTWPPTPSWSSRTPCCPDTGRPHRRRRNRSRPGHRARSTAGSRILPVRSWGPCSSEPAGEILRDLTGDCSEAAVLTARPAALPRRARPRRPGFRQPGPGRVHRPCLVRGLDRRRLGGRRRGPAGIPRRRGTGRSWPNWTAAPTCASPPPT